MLYIIYNFLFFFISDGKLITDEDSILKFERQKFGKERVLIVKNVTKDDLGSYFVRFGDLSMETELVGVGSFEKYYCFSKKIF